MIVYIGADHRGFELKESIKTFLGESGYTVNDLGNDHYDKDDDYVDFASAVSEKVRTDLVNSKGILICGSGIGMDIAANKLSQIRSSLCFSQDHAMSARNDDDANILSLPADYIDIDQAKKIISVWLQTPFSNEERHKRRLKKIGELGNSHN
jgi:ribose 5-phosphate isomerase B